MSYLSLVAGTLAGAMISATASAQMEVYPLPGVSAGLEWTGQNTPSEAGFLITGDFARALFDSMQAPTQQDVCTGGWMKQDQSGFQCAVDPDGTSTCSFGYNFGSQRLTPGPLTC